MFIHLYVDPRNLRHDARQVEYLGRQVGHVAEQEDEQWLDDADVRSETGGEGCQDAIYCSHQDATQSNN